MSYFEFVSFKIGIMMKSMIIVCSIVLLIQAKNYIFNRHCTNSKVNRLILRVSESYSSILPSRISQSSFYKFVGNIMFMNSMSIFHITLIFIFCCLKLDLNIYIKIIIMVLLLSDEFAEIILIRHRGYNRYRIECYVASLILLN